MQGDSKSKSPDGNPDADAPQAAILSDISRSLETTFKRTICISRKKNYSEISLDCVLLFSLSKLFGVKIHSPLTLSP